MVNYICDICDKNFDKKDSYIKHINRKISCIKSKITINLEDAFKLINEYYKKIIKLFLLK